MGPGPSLAPRLGWGTLPAHREQPDGREWGVWGVGVLPWLQSLACLEVGGVVCEASERARGKSSHSSMGGDDGKGLGFPPTQPSSERPWGALIAEGLGDSAVAGGR